MIRFIGRRLVHALVTLVGVSLLVFLLLELAPGKYFQDMRLNPQISPETLAGLRAQYGIDQPLPLRYANWLRSVSRGDWGFSFAYNSAVWPLLRGRLANTLILAGTALVLSWLIAIATGIWAAAHPHRWQDRLVGLGTTFLISVPDVLIALSLLAFALHTHSFPTGGMSSLAHSQMGLGGRIKDSAFHLALPLTALVAASLPMLVRHVRSSVADVLTAPFIMAARGHGIPRIRLLFRHAFPAALNPLVSLFGLSLGLLLGGSLLIEVIMSWPGMGPLLIQAIFERDPYVVVAAVMASTVLLMTGNLIADVMLFVADPRIRDPRIRKE